MRVNRSDTTLRYLIKRERVSVASELGSVSGYEVTGSVSACLQSRCRQSRLA